MITLYNGALEPLGPITHALKVGYTQKLNDMSTATLELPVQDEAASRIIVPASWARIWDGEEDLGYYRFARVPREEHDDVSVIAYELHSAECTLLDDTMPGWHEIGGEEISTRQVIEYILGYQSAQDERRWTLGRCDFEDYYQYNFENATLLEAIMSLGEVLLEPYRFVFDSTVTPWTMHLIREDDVALCSLVYRRGMQRFRRSVDGRVITRLYGYGYGEGDNQLTIAQINDGKPYLDADGAAIAQWGVRTGVHVDTRQTDPQTLRAHMEQILAAGQQPTVSYEADAIDLWRETGERWDHVTVGPRVLVLDEIMGRSVTARVTERAKEDIEGDPGSVRYALDNSVADTAEELSEIRDKIGVHELYSQGATNMYSMQIADNADAKHPLEMRFYVPGNVLRINSCMMTWEIERFRTYVTLAKSGGAGMQTSMEGGGATVSTPQTIISQDAATGSPMGGEGTGALYTEANEAGKKTREAGNHRHSTESHAHNLNAHTHKDSGSGPVPAVTVSQSPNTTYAGSHTHDIESHTHRYNHWHAVTVGITIPPMDFTLTPHSHKVSIPAHVHELEYGVYEGARAERVSLVVDGTPVPEDAYGEAREMDIAPYLRKDSGGRVTRGTYHEVRFVPSGLSRLTANLFFQVFIQSRGAGDY